MVKCWGWGSRCGQALGSHPSAVAGVVEVCRSDWVVTRGVVNWWGQGWSLLGRHGNKGKRSASLRVTGLKHDCNI